jgi:hypothetical protein
VGRKLNSIETASAVFPDANSAQSPTLSSHSQLLQQRIAQQLGISPDEFFKARVEANTAQTEDASGVAFDIALSRECLELLDAYIRITNPEQRHRCLQLVREAAYRLAHPGLATEA